MNKINSMLLVMQEKDNRLKLITTEQSISSRNRVKYSMSGQNKVETL
jgi:hypothetical protein